MFIKKLIVFILLVQIVHSIGVSPGGHKFVDPEPGTEFDIEYNFRRLDGGDITYEKRIVGMTEPGEPGYEAEKIWYDSLVLPKLTTGTNWGSTSNNVRFTGVWPEFVMPGERKIFISGIEKNDQSGSLGGIAAVAGMLYVVISHDGQFIKVQVNAPNVGAGDDVLFYYNLTDIGKIPIITGDFVVDVYRDGQLIKSIGDSYTLNDGFTSSSLSLGEFEPGLYNVTSTYNAGENSWIGTDHFIVANNEYFADCLNILNAPGIHKESFTVSSGFIMDKSETLSIKIDGMDAGELIVNIPALSDAIFEVVMDPSELSDGTYTYDLHLGGQLLCSADYTIKSADSGAVPVFVYVIVVGIIMLVALGSAWYYFRDTEGEEEF